MGYKYILLDADNTLFDFTLAERIALHEVFALQGVELTDEQHHAYHLINDALWKALERGETTREKLKTQRFAEFLDYLDSDIKQTPAEIADGYVKLLAKQQHLIDGANELCEYLYGKYKLYIITNGISFVQHSRFDTSPISGYFERIFISDEMGTAKPERAFFDKVEEYIGSDDVSEYLVIGDSLSSDIQGAVNFGCDSVWVSSDGKSDERPTYTVKDLNAICDIL